MSTILELDDTEPKPATRHLAIVLADVAVSGRVDSGEILDNGFSEFLKRAEGLQSIYNGQILKVTGDGFFAAFRTSREALSFLTILMRSLSDNPITLGQRPLDVRASLHEGDFFVAERSYGLEVFGSGVSLAARLTRFADPGQVIISGPARDALTEPMKRGLTPAEPTTGKIENMATQIETFRFNPSSTS